MRFDFKKFLSREAGIASLFALASYPVWLLLTGNWLFAGALSGLFGAGANAMRQKYFRSLSARIKADNSVAWDVEINGVKVGTITDSEYAAVRLNVFSDVRNYVAQVGNFGRVAMRAIDYCYIGIPLGAFWVMVALAVFSPDSFTAIVSEFQKTGPGAIASAVKVGAQFFGVLLIAVLGFHVMFGLSRFGFVNRFSEATARIVRKRCGVAAEGDMTLVRWVDGGPQFNDEMAYVRTGRK